MVSLVLVLLVMVIIVDILMLVILLTLGSTNIDAGFHPIPFHYVVVSFLDGLMYHSVDSRMVH
jgi:hypothetical protein